MKFLIATGNLELDRLMTRHLVAAGDQTIVIQARDGAEVLEKFQAGVDINLVLAGVSLPKISGINLCRYLRAQNYLTPVIIWSEWEESILRKNARAAGANGFLTHPFEPAKMMKLVKQALKEAGYLWSQNQSWQMEDLTLEPDKRWVERGGREIRLRNKEFLILEFMLKNSERVLSRQEIFEAVWGYGQNLPLNSNTVNAHINSLRRKVDRGFEKKLVQTVHGVGYRIMTQPEADRQGLGKA